ncbi:MAG: hypothetical protein OXU23_11085, partial [Candidatus Poribacteria bacterium]|nr:hypothetical protein [Candidatus Poribacteria bacterium]
HYLVNIKILKLTPGECLMVFIPLIYGFHLRFNPTYGIYQTHVNIPNHKDSSPDWTQIKLSVSPKDKLGVQWGKIKKEK